jgi:hypothetical protein
MSRIHFISIKPVWMLQLLLEARWMVVNELSEKLVVTLLGISYERPQ